MRNRDIDWPGMSVSLFVLISLFVLDVTLSHRLTMNSTYPPGRSSPRR